MYANRKFWCSPRSHGECLGLSLIMPQSRDGVVIYPEWRLSSCLISGLSYDYGTLHQVISGISIIMMSHCGNAERNKSISGWWFFTTPYVMVALSTQTNGTSWGENKHMGKNYVHSHSGWEPLFIFKWNWCWTNRVTAVVRPGWGYQGFCQTCRPFHWAILHIYIKTRRVFSFA